MEMNSKLYTNLRVLEIGDRLAGSVCARLFSELGADVIKIEPIDGDPNRNKPPLITDNSEEVGGVFLSQNVGKRGIKLDFGISEDKAVFINLLKGANLLISSWHPNQLKRYGLTFEQIKNSNPNIPYIYITPYGLTGPDSHKKANDINIFHSSGLAKSLIGPVEDLETSPPVRAFGEQSEFISGIAAATAASFATYLNSSSHSASLIDVSMQEALAFMEPVTLASKSFGGNNTRPRKKTKTPGPALTILPAKDGSVGISPREEHQWKSLVQLLGNPTWANDEKFSNKALREENSDEVINHLSNWTKQKDAEEIFHLLQKNRIPCYPRYHPSYHLDSEHLSVRNYFNDFAYDSGSIKFPGIPYTINGDKNSFVNKYNFINTKNIDWLENTKTKKIESNARKLPLEGIRVVDLSWVIAGPTSTRYLSSMGAEVVKIESKQRPDPGRSGQLHDVLGQAKLGLSLNLKSEYGQRIIKELISKSDVLIENFAPGVMDRLGLDWETIRKINPNLVMVSASGTGQFGPTAKYAAYGTLLQGYTGFAGLNGYYDQNETMGIAWTDPLCGMLLAYAIASALYKRQITNEGFRVDFAMVEAQLSTMPESLIEKQISGKKLGRRGNIDIYFFPNNVYRMQGEDNWISISISNDDEWISLCDAINLPEIYKSWDLKKRKDNITKIDLSISSWLKNISEKDCLEILDNFKIPNYKSLSSDQLIDIEHISQREFFQNLNDRDGKNKKMPGLPWKSSDLKPNYSKPPSLGGDSEIILKTILGYSEDLIKKIVESGDLD